MFLQQLVNGLTIGGVYALIALGYTLVYGILFMINFVLYITATLIWVATWLGIKLQLAQVPPILSVGYRFCLASVILL